MTRADAEELAMQKWGPAGKAWREGRRYYVGTGHVMPVASVGATLTEDSLAGIPYGSSEDSFEEAFTNAERNAAA